MMIANYMEDLYDNPTKNSLIYLKPLLLSLKKKGRASQEYGNWYQIWKAWRVQVLSKHLQNLSRFLFCKNNLFIGKNCCRNHLGGHQ